MRNAREPAITKFKIYKSIWSLVDKKNYTNTAILSGTHTFSGIGFAFPSSAITKIVPILIEKGYFLHAYIGLVFGTLTSDFAQDNGIPVNLNGVYVDRITENGPADKAGIQKVPQISI